MRLFHQSPKTHFICIAGGLSRLPTRLVRSHVTEDVEGLRRVHCCIVPARGLATDVVVNCGMAMALRDDRRLWIRLEGNHSKEVDVSRLLW